MARTPTTGKDPRLDRPMTSLRLQLSGHLHAPQQEMGAAQLQAAAEGKSLRIHMMLLQVLHRAPRHD
jgi:hypothetical protein